MKKVPIIGAELNRIDSTNSNNELELSDFVDIKLCNARYRFLKSQVRKFPGSVLARLSYIRINDDKVCEDEENLPDGIVWRSSTNEFVADRSPRLFDLVLQYYVHGKLHMPNWACRDEVADEFDFWDLDILHTCVDCCGEAKFDAEDDEPDEVDEKILIQRRRSTYYQVFYNRWGAIKRCLRHFLEQPSSSYFARAYAIFCMIVILLSIVNFVIGTVPEYQFCPNTTSSSDMLNSSNSSNSTTVKQIKVLPDYFDANGEYFFSDCEGTRVFQAIDIFCLIHFTVGMILRLVASQNLSRFLHSPTHIVDVLVLIPFYIEVILWATSYKVPDNQNVVFFILRIMQAIRVINIFKLARYSDHLKILALTLKSSCKEIYMLFLFVFVTILISSSILYQLEAGSKDNEMYNMVIAAWYSIVSLCTVGYGDVTPVTVGGKIVGAFVCIFCIVIVAFPMAVLVEHFSNAYKKNKKNKNVTLLKMAKMQKGVERKKSAQPATKF